MIIIRAIMAFCLLATMVAVAHAESRSIHVEWDYTPPTEPAVTGFRLYQEGVAVHDWLGGDVSEGDATMDLTERYTDFTLTALFADSTESPHSEVYTFDRDLSTGVIITWRHWLWLAKPTQKKAIMTPTLKGARLR